MGFVAGYLSREAKYETILLQEKVKSYSVLTGEESNRYENLVVETKSGHIIQKYKRNYPIQPKFSKDSNGNILVSLGFMYRSIGINDNDKLLDSCVRNSAHVLEECEGEFVSIFCEGHSGKVHIVNDRFASRPYYIFQDNDYVYFSSNLDFLLYIAGGKHAIDILGWFQIIGCGHTYGARTTLKDVRRMKPATHLTISSDGIIEKQYWRLEHKPETALNPLTYSREVFETFQAGTALRAKLVGKGVLALSGGLDSRMVAAALPKDSQFSAFTFVNSTESPVTAETRAASEVCQILGLSHQIQEIPKQEFSHVASDVIRLTGGLRPLHHMAIVMLYIDEIKRKGLNFLLGGGPADIIAGSKIPSVVYLDPNRVEECIEAFCRSHVLYGEDLALLFREDIVKQYYRDAYESLLDSFQDISGPTAAHRVTAWSMMHRWPAFTFTSLIHNHPDVTEAFCHLDYKYCDLMLKLPADWLYKRNFYSFMMYNNLPRLRHITYANTGKPLSAELMQFNYKQTLSKYAMSSVTNLTRKFVHRSRLSQKAVRLIRSKVAPSGSGSFYYSIFRGDEELLTEIADCLHSYPSLREMLDAEKCLQFLANFKADNFRAQSYNQQTELLGSLASICLSFRHLNL